MIQNDSIPFRSETHEAGIGQTTQGSPDRALAYLIAASGLTGVGFATLDWVLFLRQFHPEFLRALGFHWIEMAGMILFCLFANMTLYIILRVLGRFVRIPIPAVCSVLTVLATLAIYAALCSREYHLPRFSFLLILVVGFLVLSVFLIGMRQWKGLTLGRALGGLISVAAFVGLSTDLFLWSTREGGIGSAWKLSVFVHLVIVPPLVLTIIRFSFLNGENYFKRRIAVMAVILALASINLAIGLRSRPDGEKLDTPNVVLIVMDAMRRDHVGLYGDKAATPNIDRFFRNGIIFENAYTPSSHTLPSMTALFSARYPDMSLGKHERRDLVQRDVTTLAEELNAGGYATGAFCANRLLGPHTGMMRGFREMLLLDHHRRRDELDRVPVMMQTIWNRLHPIWRPDRRFIDTSAIILDRARRFIDRHRNRSYYLWLHLMSPHDPYDPPPNTIGDHYTGRLKPDYFAPHIEYPSELDFRSGRFVLTSADKTHIMNLYQKEVEDMDRRLGEFFQWLENQGMIDQTIFILTADHGEELWDHGDYYHGQSLHEELTAAPLLFRIPGMQGRRVSGVVQTLDIMPTLMELCAAPVQPDLDGHSLIGAMRGEEYISESVFAAEHALYQYAIRDDKYTMLWNPLRNEWRLYDRRTDPDEHNNIAAEKPDVSEKGMDAIRAKLEMLIQRAERTPDDENALKENISRLKALGYL